MEWMVLPLKRYARTSGRARRKEYWMFALFLFGGSVILAVVDALTGLDGARFNRGLLSSLFGFATLVPQFAVTVRRLHDTDRSGWWLALPFPAMIPGIVLLAMHIAAGAVIMGAGAVLISILIFAFLCLDGTVGPNRFGPDPKQPDHRDLGDIFA